MGMTRATKEKRLVELDERIARGEATAERYETLAGRTRKRVDLLQRERDWVRQAPVTDPLPGTEPEANGG